MFNPLNSLVCSCIMPYSNLIRLALYFKNISLSALSGISRARSSVMNPPAVLKRRSKGIKRTEHYPAEISGTWYHFGQNRSRNQIRKNGRISGQPEPDIRYIPSWKYLQFLDSSKQHQSHDDDDVDDDLYSCQSWHRR